MAGHGAPGSYPEHLWPQRALDVPSVPGVDANCGAAQLGTHVLVGTQVTIGDLSPGRSCRVLWGVAQQPAGEAA